MSNFGEENYDTLITKSALHSSKLLKKPDQCRAVYLCSHLFWSSSPNKGYKNGKRVLECLQKSLKIADTCMDASMNVHLFVEILNRYLYYFENGCEVVCVRLCQWLIFKVTVQYLSGLIELINTNIANMDSSADTASINSHYKNTLEYIRLKKQSDEKYKDIEI
jgi:vacuolar protein sorting-associated protein 35